MLLLHWRWRVLRTGKRACMLACTHALLHAGYRTGGLGREHAYAECTVCNPRITMCIESGAHNGSAVFDSSSSSHWMGVLMRNIKHTASWRCEIAGTGGAARVAKLLIAATTRAPARHRRDIVLGAKSQIRVCSHDAPRTYWRRIPYALAAILILPQKLHAVCERSVDV